MARKKAPEITFQEHIATYLVRKHRYPVLEQAEITDSEHALASEMVAFSNFSMTVTVACSPPLFTVKRWQVRRKVRRRSFHC